MKTKSANRQYDIVVAGGGTAGSAAAVAAARRGRRVLIVEEHNCLGGTSTAGGVGEWFASLDGMGDIFDAVLRGMRQYGPLEAGPRFFNPEYLKMVWQQLAGEAGVDVLFHASVVGAEVVRRGLTRVTIASCSLLIEAGARIFIDATGEGDLSALAGANFMQGDPSGGRVLPMTLTAWMYDTGREQRPHLPGRVEPIRSGKDLPGLGAGWRVDHNRVYLNATKVVAHDPTDPFCLSAAEREARIQLHRIVHFLQTHGYSTFALATSGATIGIREGRRIIGEYVLGEAEVLNRTMPLDFSDGIAVATTQVDFHSLTKPGDSGWRQRLVPYSIPFRCLVAKGCSNLLLAGKCISVDQVVHSSCRMTPTCCAMGQAAGTAAALAVEGGARDVREISASKLRQTLADDGMELDPGRHTPFAIHDTRLDGDDVGLRSGISPTS